MTAEVHNLAAWKNIGAAKGLLQSLVPRAQCFCFYDTGRHCVWSSDGGEDYEVDNFISELPVEIVNGSDSDSEFLKRTLNSGRVLVLMPVLDSTRQGLGVLIAIFSRNAGKASSFNPDLLKKMLLPAAQVIGETLQLSQKLRVAEERYVDLEGELDIVYKVDEKIHGASRSHVGLGQLVGQSGRLLGINYSVLLMPSKRIRVSATHSTWKDVNRKAVDRFLISNLFPQIEAKRIPTTFSIESIEGVEELSKGEFQAMLSPLFDNAGNLEGAIAQVGRVSGESFDASHKRFMSHIMRKVEYVIEQSFDSMTGLMNRAAFEAQVRDSAKLLNSDEDSHQIIYFDLDNLQLVNATFGRDAGNQVVVRFSQMLSEALPKTGVAARMAADELAILLINNGQDEAIALAETIRERCKELRYLEGDRTLQVTVSTGIATFDKSVRNPGSIITAARIACDSAKDHGRDRLEIYDSADRSIVRRYDDMHLVARIQQVLDDEEFVLLAQPIVAFDEADSISRYEILLRMSDTDGKEVSSAALFSAAERYQLMPQIDRWVVSAVLRKLGSIPDYLKDSGTVFAINLSGQTLGDDDMLKFVEEEIASNGIPASSICFEVTESAAVSNHQKAQMFIDGLRKSGCQFSLDDFGAGLSSFAYLKNFRVDTLKIDGSFIRDITENQISESMVAAITQVAKVMGLKTVAEYIETQEARALVQKLGVDFGQGFALGKPVSLDGVLTELTSSTQTA
jgi:diguanylate cyclase (GGDEF)-like protein